MILFENYSWIIRLSIYSLQKNYLTSTILLLLENNYRNCVNRKKIRQQKSQSNISSKRKSQVKSVTGVQNKLHYEKQEDNKKAATGGVPYKKMLLKILQYLQENTCVGVFQACNFIKKRLQCRCFPVNIAKFLRTLIFKNIC